MNVTSRNLLAGAVLCCALLGAAHGADKPDAPPAEATKHNEIPETFAVVGGETISGLDYLRALQAGVRQRFYHGKVPEAKMAAFRQEVARNLIGQVLLLQEARRRGLKPDRKTVQRQLDDYDARNADNPDWQEDRGRALPVLRARLEEVNLVQRLRAKVEDLPPPSRKAVGAYYRAHPDKFTTPERLRVSVILLKVDPSSPAAVWEETKEKAGQLLGRLRAGEDFAELARANSDDESAEAGGDMGFLHKGMLSPVAEQALDKLQPGEITEPVVLLEGMAILRLDERTPPRLEAFAKVEEQAAAFLSEERKERARKALLARLRRDTPITVNEELIGGPLDWPAATGKETP